MKKPKLARGGVREAQVHLRKAAENLDSAKRALAAQQYDAATSSAAIAGINASDAITLWRKGVRSASAFHPYAVGLLRSSDPIGAVVAVDLEALAGIKNVAQYSELEMSEQDATEAVRAAERIFAAAQEVTRGSRQSPEPDQLDPTAPKRVAQRILAQRRSAQLCGTWMPIARAHCVLPMDHAGPHRSGR